jgi:hypothetical protein
MEFCRIEKPNASDLAFALKGLVIPDFRHEEVSECQRALD